MSAGGGEPKRVRWLHGEVKTPPVSARARLVIGGLLRTLQDGEFLPMPMSRPMPSIGPRCHELRVNDENQTWRLVYRIDREAVVILEVFSKKTRATPDEVVRSCRARLAAYDRADRG